MIPCRSVYLDEIGASAPRLRAAKQLLPALHVADRGPDGFYRRERASALRGLAQAKCPTVPWRIVIWLLILLWVGSGGR